MPHRGSRPQSPTSPGHGLRKPATAQNPAEPDPMGKVNHRARGNLTRQRSEGGGTLMRGKAILAFVVHLENLPGHLGFHCSYYYTRIEQAQREHL